MYSRARNIIIGFHGCDEFVRDEIISGRRFMEPSRNDYDWLGNGYYFWENNYERAMYFAIEKQKRTKNNITKPAVLGAFLDLGNCLDLLDSRYLRLIAEIYPLMEALNKISGQSIPANTPISNSHDLLLRNLDCAVIELTHFINKAQKEPEYTSTRGVFWEGAELYPNAGFKEKNHIQVCIRNPNCIKGFFIPRELDTSYEQV